MISARGTTTENLDLAKEIPVANPIEVHRDS